MPPYKIKLLIKAFKMNKHHLELYRCREESDPPLTILSLSNHSIANTFSSLLCMFWIGKPQRLSHIFTVWS